MLVVIKGWKTILFPGRVHRMKPPHLRRTVPYVHDGTEPAEAEDSSGGSKKKLLIFVQNRDFLTSFLPVGTVGCPATFAAAGQSLYSHVALKKRGDSFGFSYFPGTQGTQAHLYP